MKAKMPHKPAEAGKYMCVQCDATFYFSRGPLRCPECGNEERGDLIPITVPNNDLEDDLYTDDDFQGG